MARDVWFISGTQTPAAPQIHSPGSDENPDGQVNWQCDRNGRSFSESSPSGKKWLEELQLQDPTTAWVWVRATVGRRHLTGTQRGVLPDQTPPGRHLRCESPSTSSKPGEHCTEHSPPTPLLEHERVARIGASRLGQVSGTQTPLPRHSPSSPHTTSRFPTSTFPIAQTTEQRSPKTEPEQLS